MAQADEPEAPQARAGDPTVASAATLDTPQAARPNPTDEPDGMSAADRRMTEPDALDQGGEPSYEEIRRRAYELYVERGGTHGLHDDDWFRAEQELRRKRG